MPPRRTRFRKKTKRQRQNKKTKKLNCHPAVKRDNNETCLTKEVLLQIKTDFNKDHPDSPILSDRPLLIWRELKSRILNDECNDDRCLLKEIDDPTKRHAALKSLFAPEHPPSWLKNRVEWLSNEDIDKVMAQYEQTFKDFKYLGTTSRDYDFKFADGTCVEDQLCKMNLQQLMKSGKQRFASVFNLDTHNESGSHWVSFFVSVPHKLIVFFDSAKGGIPTEIERLRDAFITQGKQNGIDFIFKTNTSDHQQGNTECGVYSIYFIVEMLRSIDNVEKFMKGNIPDKEMEEQRYKFFNAPAKISE
jgi:hypothetical protein